MRTALSVFLLAVSFFCGPVQAGDNCPVFGETQDFALPELLALIRDPNCKIKSIEGVLARLPDRMKSRFALFYKSQSLQGPHKTDYLYPRAILSSAIRPRDGVSLNKALMLSFNGKDSQPGFDRLELVEIDPTTPSPEIFKYFEIKFPEGSGPISWEEAQARITVSGPNPARCIQCHGNPARPIFQSYPFWKGAFGSAHIEVLTDEEKRGLRDFVGLHADSAGSRYRHLNPKRFSTDDSPKGSEYPEKTTSILDFHSAVQTVKINTDLADYNGLRVARLIQAMPVYPYFKYAIAAAMDDCDSIQNYLPAGLFEGLKSNLDKKFRISGISQTVIKNRFEAIQSLGESQFGIYPNVGKTLGQTLGNHKATFGNDPFMFNLWVDTMEKQGTDRIATPAANLRLIFEGLGYPIGNWFLDLKQPTYRYNSGFGQPWSNFLRITDQTLGPGPDPVSPVQNGELEKLRRRNCEFLADESLKALKDFDLKSFLENRRVPKAKSPVVTDQRPKVFETTCRTCHVDREVGPFIPFDSESKMSVWMKASGNLALIEYKVFGAHETERMPPNRELRVDEIADLKRYLGSFK